MSAAHAAGVAPGLTVEVAESLYGTSASQICDVLDGRGQLSGVDAAAGNPSGRREKLVTTDAVTYERLVVQDLLPGRAGDVRRPGRRHRPHQDHEVAPPRHTTDEIGRHGRHEASTSGTGVPRRPGLRLTDRLARPGDDDGRQRREHRPAVGLGDLRPGRDHGLPDPALLFLLPVGLVSAELATSHEGGIFVWVREAFGDRTGFQATWFVFMNSVTLYPSLLSFGAAALATAFGRPDLAGNGLYMGTRRAGGVLAGHVRGVEGDADHGRAEQPRRRAWARSSRRSR